MRRGPDCLGDNDVLDVLAGGDRRELDPLRAHLDDCDACCELLAAVAGLAGPTPPGDGAPATSPLTPGAEVGPYRLLERIGSGGMGIVYAAFDPRLDRKVALKLLRPELAALDPGMELRLVRESKAMARLSHPNVLAIHDIGALAGQVWLAMELVEGETLRAWLRTPRPWREVLAVFVAAGRGLAAAHAAGLVHRDFKPDNVLLDRGGRVLVTDFGLARPAEAAVAGSGRAAPVGDLADELTHTGALVGTPAYCAPEQQRGEATDERSDVFSFCVALHEGLHGERPFAGAPPRDPDAPWRLAAPGRRVPGWLHRAVTRGLQREPDRRYPSMNALLDALRPPRHVRAYISVGAVIVAATVGATAALLRAPPDERAQACGAARLGDGWDDARRELVRGALLVADTPRARFAWSRVEQALDGQVAAWTRTFATLCGPDRAPPGALAGARCLTARAAELAAATSALSHRTDDGPDRALRVVDALRPVDACLRADEPRDPAPDDIAGRAEAAAIRAALVEADALLLAGAFPAARAAIEPQVRRAEALGYRPVVAEALLLRGMIEGESGDPYAGARIVRQAANAAEASRHERAAADAWSYLAFVTAQRLGDLERAREYADQADAAIERLAGDPERAARVAHYRGLIALRAGDPEGGRGWFERAIALHREAGHEPHVVVLEGLALALGEAGRHTEAIEQFTRVLALRREQFGPDHPDLVDTHTNLAAELVDLGREEEALAHMQAAVDLHAAAYGPDHHEVGLLYYDLGEVLRTLGHPDEGLAHNSHALAIARRVHGDEHSDVALVREYRAGLLLDLGRHDEAIALLREVLASYRRTGGDNGALIAHCRLSLADALRRAGRPDEALAHAREGLAQLEPLLPASSALRGYARTAVARVLIAAGHASEALPALEESLASYPADDTNPYQRALTQATLAQALFATDGDRVRARELARTARDTLARGGAGWASEHDTIDRWLAALPPESPSPRSIAAPK